MRQDDTVEKMINGDMTITEAIQHIGSKNVTQSLVTASFQSVSYYKIFSLTSIHQQYIKLIGDCFEIVKSLLDIGRPEIKNIFGNYFKDGLYSIKLSIWKILCIGLEYRLNDIANYPSTSKYNIYNWSHWLLSDVKRVDEIKEIFKRNVLLSRLPVDLLYVKEFARMLICIVSCKGISELHTKEDSLKMKKGQMHSIWTPNRSLNINISNSVVSTLVPLYKKFMFPINSTPFPLDPDEMSEEVMDALHDIVYDPAALNDDYYKSLFDHRSIYEETREITKYNLCLIAEFEKIFSLNDAIKLWSDVVFPSDGNIHIYYNSSKDDFIYVRDKHVKLMNRIDKKTFQKCYEKASVILTNEEKDVYTPVNFNLDLAKLLKDMYITQEKEEKEDEKIDLDENLIMKLIDSEYKTKTPNDLISTLRVYFTANNIKEMITGHKVYLKALEIKIEESSKYIEWGRKKIDFYKNFINDPRLLAEHQAISEGFFTMVTNGLLKSTKQSEQRLWKLYKIAESEKNKNAMSWFAFVLNISRNLIKVEQLTNEMKAVWYDVENFADEMYEEELIGELKTFKYEYNPSIYQPIYYSDESKQ